MKEKLRLISIQRLAHKKPGVCLFGLSGLNIPVKTEEIDRKQLEFMERREWKNLSIASEDYPFRLRQISDPPLVMTVQGDISSLGSISAAIVGARKASPFAKEFAYKASKMLAASGYVIVSGLAYGVDSCAHRGALRAGGRTVAVLGCGIDVHYPSRNIKLRFNITSQGCVITEYPLGTQPWPSNFPRRNRIISGMSCCVVIVEAGRRSGSLITAQMALEQGKDVYVVKPRTGAIYNEGNRILMEDGAIIVDSVEDLAAKISCNNKELLCGANKSAGHSCYNTANQPTPATRRGAALDAKRVEFTLEDIAALCDLTPTELLVWARDATSKGLIEELPNGRYRRRWAPIS